MSDIQKVEIDERDGIVVATVTGEIDLANAAEVERAVIGAAATGRVGLVVDLSAVTFLDSSGVRFLDHVVAQQPPDRPLIVVATESGRARFTLRLCGFPDELLRPDLAATLLELGEPRTP